MSLEKMAELSRELGCRGELVLAGGGNSSWKDSANLYIKPSGVALAAIQSDDFVRMDRALLRNSMTAGAAAAPADRESVVKRHIDFAVLASKNGRRPSVEAPLHSLFPQSCVMHLHPTLINAMTCGKKGAEICAKLFPEALWMPYVDPGATLAIEAEKAFRVYAEKHGGQAPELLFIQNHGIFMASDDPAKISQLCSDVVSRLTDFCKAAGLDPAAEPDAPESDPDFVRENAPVLRGLLTSNGCPAAVSAMKILDLPEDPFTPDHIVYSGSHPLVTDTISKDAVEAYRAKYGRLPRIILVPGKALFAAGSDVSAMRRAAAFIRDTAAIKRLSAAFGGAQTLSAASVKFIEEWEMEAYRLKCAGGSSGQLAGKIALVTGGAQGFGYGISEALIKEGAHVIVADLNAQGAAAAAVKLGPQASSLAVDVSNEESIAALADAVIRDFGGLDLFVSNAGVLKAGSVKTFEKKSWDFVTSVNYTGYFLCVKHFAPMMARQNAASGLWTDFVQVNSKSGLVGSNKNAAYAAGKFGTIGMTQSFALELVADNIKVNSVCPGNYYDGPLWSDPERGLFRQYFDSGKVPGAKTLQDVKDFYLSKSPIRRGCFPADVAKAIVYACVQQFETGQAIPVTGGQVMLN